MSSNCLPQMYLLAVQAVGMEPVKVTLLPPLCFHNTLSHRSLRASKANLTIAAWRVERLQDVSDVQSFGWRRKKRECSAARTTMGATINHKM